MNIPETVKELILNADGKALATSTPDGVHVVPVSTIKLSGEQILLVDYFMGKTVENVLSNPKVALACWRGLEGYQIKGTVSYVTEGEAYGSVKEWAKEVFPTRTVRGILLLTPKEIFDVSATAEQPGVKLVVS